MAYVTYLVHSADSFLRNCFAYSQEIPRIFMEPEVSLPHSQASATCPYIGPAQTSPHNHIPPPGDCPNIIHPSVPRSPLWSLSLRFPHQDPTRPPLLTHTRHIYSFISLRRSTYFRRVFPSIIRSTKLHIQRQVFVRRGLYL